VTIARRLHNGSPSPPPNARVCCSALQHWQELNATYHGEVTTAALQVTD
jgi:hypothetical protein